ncbi:hypothetical protein [Nissabacter archeti]|nr:hypothetical protein [Nissabacter archeti]
MTPDLISTAIATLFIWAHLTRIGQTSLFFDSVSFPSIFSYLMVFACVSVLAFCLILFMPSLLAGLFLYKDKEDSETQEKLAENSITIVLVTSLLSVFVLFVYYFLSMHIGKKETQNIYLQLGAIYLISFVLTRFFNTRITCSRINGVKPGKKFRIVLLMHFFQPVLFSLTACIYIFPLELFLRTLDFPDGTGEIRQALTVIALSIFLIIFSFIPGVVFLRLRARTSLLRQVTVTGGIMGGVLLVIVHMVPALILTMFLRTSGIMDLSPHVYGVPTASYPAEYFSDGAWRGTRSSDEKYYLLQAVDLYALGDIRLICPLDVIQTYKNSLKYQVLDADYDKSARAKLQDAASHCRRVKGQELLTLQKLPEVKAHR